MHDTRLLADHGEVSVGDAESGVVDSGSILRKIEMPYRAVKLNRHLSKASGRQLRLVSSGQGRAAAPLPSASAALMPPLDFIPRSSDYVLATGVR